MHIVPVATGIRAYRRRRGSVWPDFPPIQARPPQEYASSAYDARDQTHIVQDIEGGLPTWGYDGRQMITQQQNPNGTATNISYDGNRQALTIRHTHPDGTRLDSAL